MAGDQLGQPSLLAPLEPVALVEEETLPRGETDLRMRLVLVRLHSVEDIGQEIPNAIRGGERSRAAGTRRTPLGATKGLRAVGAAEANERAGTHPEPPGRPSAPVAP